MRRTYTPDELRTIRDAIHSTSAQHHPAENARGREAVDADPSHRNHSPGVAAWMIQLRQERIALDVEDLEARIAHGHGGPWTFELMHRIEANASEVAYWEGVHAEAINRSVFRGTLV